METNGKKYEELVTDAEAVAQRHNSTEIAETVLGLDEYIARGRITVDQRYALAKILLDGYNGSNGKHSDTRKVG